MRVTLFFLPLFLTYTPEELLSFYLPDQDSFVINGQSYTPKLEGGHHGTVQLIPEDNRYWVNLAISIGLIFVAGLCSGLTLGFMSIDELSLELKLQNGTSKEKQMAAKILPIVHKHHKVLVTLMVTNALAMESLPIFMLTLVPPAAAVLISSVFLVLFGEIIPQSICTGKNQVLIAYKFSDFVSVLMNVFACIISPIANLLDRMLGEHQKTRFQKKDLRSIIELHEIKKDQLKQLKGIKSTGLSSEEATMVISLIDLKNIQVREVMIPQEKIFKLQITELLDEQKLLRIDAKSFSKLPVFDQENLIGFLKVKSNPITLDKPLTVSANTSLFDLLSIFQQTKQNIAIAQDNKASVGLICLVDIFERILKMDLDDGDIHHTLRQNDVLLKVQGDQEFEMIEGKLFMLACEGVERDLKKPLLR